MGGTLSARDYKSPNQLLVGTRADGFCAIDFHAEPMNGAVAPTLTASKDPSRSPQSTEITQQVAAVVAAYVERHQKRMAIAFPPTQDPISSVDVSHTVSTGSPRGQASGAVCLLTPNGGRAGMGVGAVAIPAMSVRRLTPTETERLQGFPDGWTAEGIDAKGNRKPQADGPRYKQMGNAVTVNVAEWIAHRLIQTL